MIYLRYGLILVLAGALAACSTTQTPEPPSLPTKKDGAPAKTLNPEKIKNPEPKHESYSKYGNPPSYTVSGKKYEVWDSHVGYEQTGLASWYGTKFHGQLTSSREPYDMYAMTAAHKNLPIPSYAKVTNLDNGKSIIVRINDRGPFAENRIIDLSYAAATKLNMLSKGTARVKVESIDSRGRLAPAPNYASSGKKSQKVYLQVASFSEKSAAEKLANTINRRGSHEADIESSAQSKMYRVLVGPFAHEAEANAFHQKLADLNLGKAMVLKR